MRPDQLLLNITPVIWTDSLQHEFAKIAIEGYPTEVCAYVINNKLVPVNNIAENPTVNFELSLADSLLACKAQAFVHSHPDGPYHPSELDMRTQKSANIPFGIVTTGPDSCSLPVWVSDANLDAPLEQRPFIHGVFDCYSLCRAYYWQSRKLKLNDYPREFEWWEGVNGKPPENLYLDNFIKEGFVEVPRDEVMQPGDGILMNIQSTVVSHAAIYLGEGLILHHLRGKISKKDNAHSWKKFYHTVLRYNGKN